MNINTALAFNNMMDYAWFDCLVKNKGKVIQYSE